MFRWAQPERKKSNHPLRADEQIARPDRSRERRSRILAHRHRVGRRRTVVWTRTEAAARARSDADYAYMSIARHRRRTPALLRVHLPGRGAGSHGLSLGTAPCRWRQTGGPLPARRLGHPGENSDCDRHTERELEEMRVPRRPWPADPWRFAARAGAAGRAWRAALRAGPGEPTTRRATGRVGRALFTPAAAVAAVAPAAALSLSLSLSLSLLSSLSLHPTCAHTGIRRMCDVRFSLSLSLHSTHVVAKVCGSARTYAYTHARTHVRTYTCTDARS